ncbi:hypothetical protein OVA14_04950 [Agrococcus sp. SL85]|uniref:hypothetical protein n=1 Tax=Agrococcus sp. SL85 TaxID=2995141 RepID=UPI00226CB008|nr:hypothetical protein [Agrococcus sp. SL85]WAC67102.1 hypothetical protein OVA14_04950 [Agrococcus sp. SL85]
MRGRILLVIGFGAGYVLGAKAGRQRYEQIASAADKLWNSQGVAKQRHEVQRFVETKAPKLVEAATDAAGEAIDKVTRRDKGRGAGSKGA